MPDFDAEIHLRLIGERMLLEPGIQNRDPKRPAIAEAATALVAVGAIDPDCAERLLDDYSFAATLRNDPHFRHRAMRGASRHTDPSGCTPLKPRRVVPCAHTVEHPQGTLRLRYVSLSEEATSVAVTWHPDPSRPWNSALPSAALTDDRGTTEAARFTGDGSTHGFHGRLTTARPLALDTAWLELDGNRLELTGAASDFDANLEPMPAQDPAYRYLWQRMAEPSEYYENGIEPAIDALVAADALSLDDPQLAEVRAVLEAMQRRSPGSAVGPPPGPSRMREPWRSLLARHGCRDGPTGAVVLGAVPPAFDGFSVAVMDLESEANRFKVDVEAAPALGRRMPFDWAVGPRQLAWWAKDDRGNHYLGQRGNWNFTADYGHGLIDFRPALDPGAKELALMPTGETTRAVIAFSLPWTP